MVLAGTGGTGVRPLRVALLAALAVVGMLAASVAPVGAALARPAAVTGWSPAVTGTAAETTTPTKETAPKSTDPPGQPAQESDTAEADAASVVWEATLTVGADDSQPSGSGYSRWAGVGDLSERGLTLGGTSMRHHVNADAT